MSRTLAEIASFLGLPYQGDGNRNLEKVAGLEAADESCLVFWESSSKAPPEPIALRGACLIARRDSVPESIDAIFSERPKLDFARAAAFIRPRIGGTRLHHSTAIVSDSAHIEEDVDLGPHVVVGSRSRIGRGTVLHAGVVVGNDCNVGEDCVLHPNVILYEKVELGNRVVLHAGVVIGGDGFGYVADGMEQVKFPQVGGVLIEDDVEIGCNSTVDRGSLGTTRIGAGAKIDNLVQIAHNVEIGRGVVIAAQTGISGSTVIEDLAVIGGQVGFGDHARVQSGAVIGSKAGVLPGKIVRGGETYWGVPVRPLREYKTLNALFGRLPELKADIDGLKRTVAELLAKSRHDK